MKTTLVLHWRALVSKIHPPLPMSPRESLKVLTLLNASLNRHLDLAYPPGLGDQAHSPNNHVRSILASPLFRTMPRFRQSRHARPKSKGPPSLDSMHLMKNPMAYFQENIAAGMADLELAKLSLEIQKKNCLASPTGNVRKSLKNTGAGSIMLNWLWSSGMEENLDFMRDTGFTKQLIVFLVAEKCHDRVVMWLRRIYEDPNFSPEATKKAIGPVLLQLIKSENWYGNGLGSAIGLFLDLLEERGAMEPSSKGLYPEFRAAGRYIALAIPDSTESTIVAGNLVNVFLKSVKRWAVRPSFEYAWLNIHHPKQPNPNGTLQYLEAVSAKNIMEPSGPRRLRVVRMSLQAADAFIHHGDRASASWIRAILESHFAEDIGYENAPKLELPTTRDETREEEVSLHLLGQLAVH